MEPHQHPSSFSSLRQLLEELESLIILESRRNSNSWLSIARLSEIFSEKHGISLEDVAITQGHGDDLRSLFRSSRRFSIYGTQMPQDFYVALLSKVVSSHNQNQIRPIRYKNKRPPKADGNRIRSLKADRAKGIPSRQSQGISGCQPILIAEIKSVDDLETVLIEIIKSLAANYPKRLPTVAILSQKFYDYYGQPIRTVVRNVCSDIKLIDLLQTIPNLDVQEVNNDWQITLRADLSG